jgi:glycine/D-amino acid oxidase-like deaminating enzyme
MRALIAGGGMAGLMTALALRESGVFTTIDVCEQTPTPTTAGAGAEHSPELHRGDSNHEQDARQRFEPGWLHLKKGAEIGCCVRSSTWTLWPQGSPLDDGEPQRLGGAVVTGGVGGAHDQPVAAGRQLAVPEPAREADLVGAAEPGACERALGVPQDAVACGA